VTALSQRKTRLVFETAGEIFERGHGRQIIVEARPYFAYLKLKGSRRVYTISYETIYRAAVQAAVDTERAARKAARKVGRR